MDANNSESVDLNKKVKAKVKELISIFGSKELALKAADQVYAVRGSLKARDYISFVKFWVHVSIELRK